MVSSSISLPSSGFFSSFPHGTCPLSVSKEYLALEGGPPRFRQGFTCPVLLRIPAHFAKFQIRGFHSLWRDFPDTSPISLRLVQVLQPQQVNLLVWAIPVSLAATNRISIDFSSSRYLDVSVPSVRSTVATLLTTELLNFHSAGLPHSEIPGSKPIWRLPETYRRLIHVLHRLLLPRHPPYTLSNFCFWYLSTQYYLLLITLLRKSSAKILLI